MSTHCPMNLRALQEQAIAELASTRLCRAAMQENIQRSQYVAFMRDVYCYAQHSAQVIALAGARIASRLPVMAAYLFAHAGEELGHDGWAYRDLLDLGLTSEQLMEVQPTATCLRMIALEYLFATQMNAVGLFGWMFVLESLGGRVGGEVAARIDKTLHLQGQGLSLMEGPRPAATHHSECLYQVISDNLRTTADCTAFETMFRESLELYGNILESAYAAAAGPPPIEKFGSGRINSEDCSWSVGCIGGGRGTGLNDS